MEQVVVKKRREQLVDVELRITATARKTMRKALREYIDKRILINEYVERTYPTQDAEWQKEKIRNVGDRVREVRAILAMITPTEDEGANNVRQDDTAA